MSNEPSPAKVRLTDGLGPLVDSEEDPARLWAEIHRLRAAVQGPDGYATWQDAATAERVRRVKAEKAQANVQVLVLTAVHHAVEACANATGQHRVIAHFVNKTHLANEVMEAVSSVAAEVRA
jgi:hypothetical protein